MAIAITQAVIETTKAAIMAKRETEGSPEGRTVVHLELR